MPREREAWPDAVKILACILVVLGNLFQSMASSTVLLHIMLGIAVSFCRLALLMWAMEKLHPLEEKLHPLDFLVFPNRYVKLERSK
jgi:hypothetical protein